jgi:acetyl-CoA C-acetyltransferase
LGLPEDGSQALTVTGGLPYFGGPGNNYSMHALVEMAQRLRGSEQRALVTANGGILSKHAAAILAAVPNAGGAQPLDLTTPEALEIDRSDIPSVPMAEAPESGTVLSYTVIFERNKPDRAVILGETEAGERFLANSEDEATVESFKQSSPVGKPATISSNEGRNSFRLSN